ncbi:MAG: ABC transporter permease [Candidatus Methanomethylophilaceae archaeon]|nr:ABC transporter permease [Candidatus Methanomethylophilaceae archaeon]
MTPRAKWFLMRGARFAAVGFVVLTIIFMLPRVMPGDPIENLLGEGAVGLSEAARAELLSYYKLDRPIWEQYIAFLQSIFTFDFGYSITRARPVSDLIVDRIGWTLLLTLPSIAIGSAAAIYASVYCGTRRGSVLDRLLVGISIYSQTIPTFLIAMIIILVLSIQLGLFPISHLSSGRYTGIDNVLDIIYHMILPVSTLTLTVFLGKFLILRNTTLQIAGEQFVFVARSKGMPENAIRSAHVMRNIMPTFLSMLIMNIGFMISGALLIEIVFSLQGMGTLVYYGISSQDFPVIQGTFIIIVAWVLFTNILAEFIYGVIDPRVGDSVEGVKNRCRTIVPHISADGSLKTDGSRSESASCRSSLRSHCWRRISRRTILMPWISVRFFIRAPNTSSERIIWEETSIPS